jgi:hypothetical protein
MRAYNPYYTSIPSTVVPLFSETYATLLTVPDTYSSNRYNQYHYGIGSYLQQSPPHASSPDYETRVRSYSTRDVRVPLKEENSDDSDDDYRNHSPGRSTSLISSTASSLYDCSKTREHSLIHSRQPISTSIHQRSLNDDLNALTYYSYEPGKKNLQNNPESSNGILTKSRSSSSIPTNKRLELIDPTDDDMEENFYFNKPPRMIYQPAMISLSSIS